MTDADLNALMCLADAHQALSQGKYGLYRKRYGWRSAEGMDRHHGATVNRLIREGALAPVFTDVVRITDAGLARLLELRMKFNGQEARS